MHGVCLHAGLKFLVPLSKKCWDFILHIIRVRVRVKVRVMIDITVGLRSSPACVTLM